MNIITVIPLTRSKMIDSLSYFTKADVPVGAIVSVPIRRKTTNAIVAESRTALDIKQEIKKAPYEIRRLNQVKSVNFFPTPFAEAAKKLAHYYVSTLGAVIDGLTADILIENASKITLPGTPQGAALTRRLNLESSTLAVQGDDDDRMSSWRSLIRQEFAKKKSVVFYVPTIEDVSQIGGMLSRGIEEYIFLFHSSLPKKKILETWKQIADTEHPVVVVATPSFSILPRQDIDTMVIERENGRGWISQKHPYMDLRHALETMGHENGQVIYRGDIMLRTETLRRVDTHDIAQGSPFKWRSISLAEDIVINMATEKKPHQQHDRPHTGDTSNANAEEKPSPEERATSKSRLTIISPELENLIRRNREESSRLFIYAARRGAASVTICDDCENIVLCTNCGAPVVLHAPRAGDGTGRNFFMCHLCGERRSADETCKTCGGWKLTALGIGIDRVRDELTAKFPNAEIYQIDADTTPTKKQMETTLEKFYARPGNILLGTDLALTHVREKIDYTAIASLDSLFSLPDFRIPEKIMYTLVRLRYLSTKAILVQTRKSDERVFAYGPKGNLSDFYRETLAERRQFGYPPFTTLIKISIEGKKDAIAALMAEAKKTIEPFEMDIFPAFTASQKDNSIIHGLIKIESHLWPNSELVTKLKTLPPAVAVKVNPESLL